MIVEGMVVTAIVATVLVGPFKGILMMLRLLDNELEKPITTTIQNGEEQIVVVLDGMLDEEGKPRFGVVKFEDGHTYVLTEAEYRLLAQLGLLKALLGEKGKRLKRAQARRLVVLLEKRKREILEDPKRRCAVKKAA